MPRPTATARNHASARHAAIAKSKPARQPGRVKAPPGYTVHLCVPDDQLMYLPSHVKPGPWPAASHLPRIGDVLYLTSTSAWLVVMVIHECIPTAGVRIEVWVEHCGAARMQRPDDAAWFH